MRDRAAALPARLDCGLIARLPAEGWVMARLAPRANGRLLVADTVVWRPPARVILSSSWNI
ncbi:hypothetical protein D3C76_1872230 [compost metagenome]